MPADRGRNRLALALDVEDLAAAVALADRLHPWFGVVKVGLELFTAAGPAAVETLSPPGPAGLPRPEAPRHPDHGRARRPGRSAGSASATSRCTPPAGSTCSGPASTGLAAGAADAGVGDRPVALGVTVLTSDPDASAFPARLDAAVAGGCGGVVCSVRELPTVKESFTPAGGRTRHPTPRWAPTHDQARVGTPAEAIAAGADLLVIGRAVTAAPDPEAAAAALSAATIS